MATGSGTGTPVTSSSDATLSTLRDRVRTQIDKASGVTEPLVVTASSIELASGTPNLRDRLEATLQDSGNSRWSTDDLDEAIRQALEQYTKYEPAHAIGTITLSANGREIDISSLSDAIRIEKVWWDYDSSDPSYPPNWRKFEVWPGQILHIDDDDEPQSGDVVRIWYTKMHTVKGLDSATATTIPEEDVGYVITGAAHFAAMARAVELSETLNVDKDVVSRLTTYADEMGTNFRYGARRRQPAWQRYAFAYSQEDIDEALRWALHRYSDVDPDRNISTITLSSDGREIDISSITDYLTIERVWWDYDSSDPDYPPNWRDFELWPGDILFIKDSDEPDTSDVVRVWYTRMHTLNGLDGASVTTIPESAETLLVIGAAGFAAQERAQEKDTTWIPTKIREWAEARLKEFESGLHAVSRREGIKAAGIAKAPALDRWDEDEDW